MGHIKVSVCIVNWNTKDLLYRCLRSIKDKTANLLYEVIIVDNASNDASVDMVREEFPDYKILALNENIGFARGNNVAAREARGDHVLYLNPDTELLTNAIYGMYTFLETHQEFGAAGCKLIYGNGEIQNTCASTFPMPFNEFSSLFLLNRLFPRSRIFSARELDYWDHKDSRSVDCLSGACMMVRKSIVDKVGGFDDKIFMYADDVDFCMRILKEGYQIYYLSTETIVHYEGSGTKKTGKKNFSTLFQKESERYVINKHFGPGKAACYTLVVLAGSVFRIIFSILIFPLLMMKSKNEDKNLSDILSKYSSLLLWSINIKKLTRP